MRPSKLPMALIEQVRRVLEDTPECREEEVTKVQAIRMLAPQIHAMQSKGYGLKAIAALLSDKGIAVSVVSLKSYLRHVKGAGIKKPPRRGKKNERVDRRSSGDARDRVPAVSALSDSTTRSGVEDEAGRGGASGAKVVRIAPAPAIPRERTAEPPKQGSAPAEETAQRRSTFVPRSDTDDI
jgi:hypothetical protein